MTNSRSLDRADADKCSAATWSNSLSHTWRKSVKASTASSSDILTTISRVSVTDKIFSSDRLSWGGSDGMTLTTAAISILRLPQKIDLPSTRSTSNCLPDLPTIVQPGVIFSISRLPHLLGWLGAGSQPISTPKTCRHQTRLRLICDRDAKVPSIPALPWD